jgi:uncharacterized protein (DUF58 family)
MWTRKAKLLAALVPVFYLIGLLNNSAAAFLMCFVTFGLVLGGWVWARWMSRRVRCECAIPSAHTSRDEPVAIAHGLRAPRWSGPVKISNPIVNLTLDETDAYECVLEPGDDGPPSLAAGGEAARLSDTLRFAHRGHYRIGPATLTVRDPFGLFERRVTSGGSAEIIVYPRTLALPGAPLLGMSAYRLRDLRTAPAAGEAVEFHGVRPYQHGDDLRHIHWKSTAHTGQLIIKQFERRSSASATIFLDLDAGAHRGHGADSSLEPAVEMAASLAEHVVRSGGAVRLVANGAQPTRLEMDRGYRHLLDMMDVFAVARADGGRPIGRVLHEEARAVPAGSTMFLVTPSADLGLLRHLTMLRARGVDLVVVLLLAHTFGDSGSPSAETYDRLLAPLLASGITVYPIRRGDDLTSVTKTARLWL